jgi:hypothetical protein
MKIQNESTAVEGAAEREPLQETEDRAAILAISRPGRLRLVLDPHPVPPVAADGAIAL